MIPQIYRVAAKDDLVPLSKPITSTSGKQFNEVLVPKGTRIVVSIAAYNRSVSLGVLDVIGCRSDKKTRNPDLWGEDAHVFNPDRWLNGAVKEGVSVGVYANL